MAAQGLAGRVAGQAWAEARHALESRPLPQVPLVVALAGVPLSGKSTVARALAGAAARATLHVENDALRARVAAALGRAGPEHTGPEHYLTYQAAWELLGLALAAGANAIHDATHLDERSRSGAYDAAERAGAACVVLVVRTAPEVLAARAATLPASRQRAFAKLGARVPAPAPGRPCLEIDGAQPVERTLQGLRSWGPLAPLFDLTG